MAPTATLLYGFEVDNGWLPERVNELALRGMGARQALAAYLREQCGDSVELGDYDDHVNELSKETGLWVEVWGDDRFFITTKKLNWHRYDVSYGPIKLGLPTPADNTNLRAIAEDMSPALEPALQWFLLADND